MRDTLEGAPMHAEDQPARDGQSATTASHSFQRLLDAGTTRYTQYVKSPHRYRGIVSFLASTAGDPRQLKVVDIGCGAGVISRGLAETFATVTGIDQSADNVRLARDLTTTQELRGKLDFLQGSAFDLPLPSGSVDCAVLNGVLEWVGQNDRGANPRELQRQALQEACRVLRPGGVLYVAIENRLHPRTLLRDPHTGLPIVNLLPHRLATRVSKPLFGRKFQTYLYGCGALRRLFLQGGFAHAELFTPFPGYQYPMYYIPLASRTRSLQAIQSIDASAVEDVLRDAGRKHDVAGAVVRLRRRARYGLLQFMTHDFAALCRKG